MQTVYLFVLLLVCFTDGLKKFDEYYEKGYIHKVITTDLNYRTPELLERPYYEPAAMGKYLASIMDTLNHDVFG